MVTLVTTHDGKKIKLGEHEYTKPGELGLISVKTGKKTTTVDYLGVMDRATAETVRDALTRWLDQKRDVMAGDPPA